MARPDEDDEYEVPLRDQRFFGAGLKRKRIHFVASTSTSHTHHDSPRNPSASAADRYLSIVFGGKSQDELTDHEPRLPAVEVTDSEEQEPESKPDAASELLVGESVCLACHKPVAAAQIDYHDRSIAHQVCLQHSYPPSHLDRTRKGLAVLEGQGWDPDSRLGLGAKGEGRLHPVKAVENPGKAGLGAQPQKVVTVPKKTRLDAKKSRQLDKEQKKRAGRLRDAFYRNEDVEKYLGM